MKWEGPQRLLKVHACYTVLLLKINVNFSGRTEKANKFKASINISFP